MVALLIGIAFAWYALLGPGSARGSRAPDETPSPTPTATTLVALPTAAPTDTPPPPPTIAPPTDTPVPLPTPLPTVASNPQITLVAGADGANVRKGPGTYYVQLGRLDPGASAVVTGRYERWVRIDFDGADGWVANWVVEVSDIDSVPQVEPPTGLETPTPDPTAEPAPTAEATLEETPPTEEPPTEGPAPATATLTAGVDGANVRTGPGTAFERIGRLDPGNTAVVTGRYERWYQIDYNGTPGWVAEWVVTVTGAENVPQVEPPVATPVP